MPRIVLTEDEIEQVVEYLEGTYMSLEAALLKVLDIDTMQAGAILSRDSLERLDLELFVCDGCDCYTRYRHRSVSQENLCSDCAW